MNVLEFNNVRKSYSDFLIDDINFELPEGCVLGLVGENGAGKTTMMKLILSSIKMDGGAIRVFGRDNIRDSSDLKQDIGVVFAENSFPEMLTSRQIGRVMELLYQNWDMAGYVEYLKMFGLDGKKKYKEYSRGMKMKQSIAVAMSHGARLLLLDEATSGLDPIARDELLDILNGYTKDERHSILISSHITSDLEKICDYIAFIHKGRLVLCEEKDTLLNRYGILHCTRGVLGELAEDAVAGCRFSQYGAEALVVRDRIPATFDVAPAGLDDIFVYMIRGRIEDEGFMA